jgi:hypothetical protein
MKPDHLTPPLCSGCQQTAHLASRLRRIHRGDRVLAVDSWTWECSRDCADPFSGERPFRFADQPLLAWEQEQIRDAWQARFGEPLPPSERGKHPGPHRSVRVPVMLTPAEAARLDKLRGELTRSEFLRRAISGAGDR